MMKCPYCGHKCKPRPAEVASAMAYREEFTVRLWCCDKIVKAKPISSYSFEKIEPQPRFDDIETNLCPQGGKP